MRVKLAYLTYLIVICAVALLINSGKHSEVAATPPLVANSQAITQHEKDVKQKFLESQSESNGLTWLDYHTVAHALGSIEHNRATNSIDAMAINYEDYNMRVFETDLILTSDKRLVARHDWLSYLYALLGQFSSKGKQSIPLSYEEFKHLKMYNKFSPTDFETLATILKNHKDIYLITDTKSTKPEEIKEQFQQIVNTAKATDQSILDRLIIQVYNQAMYSEVKAIYPFKNMIYATYMNNDSPEQIIQFCKTNNIPAVAILTDKLSRKLSDELQANNIKIIVHSVNTEEARTYYRAMGASMIYSDYLAGL